MTNIKGGIFMFLFGLILGLVVGLSISKIKDFFNNIDKKSQAFAEDLSQSFRYFRWKRECRKNDI